MHISTLDADPPPMIYLCMFQVESGCWSYGILAAQQSTGSDPINEVQQQVWGVDKDLPIYNTSMASLVSESIAQRRFSGVAA